MKVKLEDVIDGIEMQSEEGSNLLNLETGEVVYVSRESLWIAEDEEEYDHLPEWQQEEVKLAYDIVESFDKYKPLPTGFDINEYNMMEQFGYQLEDNKAQDRLLKAIRGKGVFRRFKDTVIHLGIDDKWYDYRDACYKKMAIEFCESNGIAYLE